MSRRGDLTWRPQALALLAALLVLAAVAGAASGWCLYRLVGMVTP